MTKKVKLTLITLLLAIFTCLCIVTVISKYTTTKNVARFNLHINSKIIYAVYNADDKSLNFYFGYPPETAPTNSTVYSNHVGTESYIPEWTDVASSVESVNIVDVISPTSTSGWFAGFTNAISIDLENLNTLATVDMSNMFDGCTQVDTLTLGKNFGNGVGATLNADYIGLNEISQDWFKEDSEQEITCEEVLTSGAGVYTANAVYCFATIGNESPAILRIYQRKGLPKVGETFDGYKINSLLSWRKGETGKGGASEGCRSPKNADGTIRHSWGSSWNYKNAYEYLVIVDEIAPESLAYWFDNANNCRSFDLKNLDTSNVKSMKNMFYKCSDADFSELDLSNFDTSSVTDMTNMFYNCSALQTIYVSENFVMTNVNASSNMFYGCSSIVGGMQTTYKTGSSIYACIDGGETKPGYFTAHLVNV